MADVIKSSYLSEVRSVQQAELILLTHACPLADIYFDSHCAFGVAYNFGMLWKQRGFLTASEQPVQNEKLVAEWLDSCLLYTSDAADDCWSV